MRAKAEPSRFQRYLDEEEAAATRYDKEIEQERWYRVTEKVRKRVWMYLERDSPEQTVDSVVREMIHQGQIAEWNQASVEYALLKYAYAMTESESDRRQAVRLLYKAMESRDTKEARKMMLAAALAKADDAEERFEEGFDDPNKPPVKRIRMVDITIEKPTTIRKATV